MLRPSPMKAPRRDPRKGRPISWTTPIEALEARRLMAMYTDVSPRAARRRYTSPSAVGPRGPRSEWSSLWVGPFAGPDGGPSWGRGGALWGSWGSFLFTGGAPPGPPPH